MQLSFFASAAIILSGDVCPQPGPLNQVVYDVPSLSIKANGLSIAHLNVRSLTGKIDQLNLVMSNNKGPDIWTFSETWLSNSSIGWDLGTNVQVSLQSPNDEGLSTLRCEVEAILNSKTADE